MANIFDILNTPVTTNRNRERRMCFYGRVSTEHEAQLSALQNQMQWYDDQLKFHPNWILVDRYIDEGITGTQARKRPAFLRMIDDAKKGKFDLIVTREVCRFARNTVDTLVYTRELKSKYGIEVFFVEDNIWTMDGDGELRLTLMATLAQEESRKVSERVKAGQHISRENKTLYGNGNILGYDRKDGTYVINEEQAETVRMIYKMYLDGLGESKIRNELIRLHRKDGSGNVSWSASKINRILKRATYKGVIAYGQSYSNNYLEQKRVNNKDSSTYRYEEVDIPIIISPDDWDRVQAIRESKCVRTPTRTAGKKKADDIWLRKLKCKCGASFRKNKWRTNKTTGEVVFGYQCYNQLNNGSKSFREKQGLDTEGYCDIRMIGDWKLDLMAKEVIHAIWQERKAHVITAYEMVVENYRDESSVNAKRIKDLKQKLDKVQSKIQNLIVMRTEGELTKEEYLAMREKLDTEKLSIETELDTLEQEHESKTILEDNLAVIKEALDTVIDFSQDKLPEYIIETFIEKVVPIDNNLFRWYIKLLDGGNDDGNGSSSEEVVLGVEGRKNNPSLINEIGEKSLPFTQLTTGSYRWKIGEYLTYNLTISFEKARMYRKKGGKYLRCNQWDDIQIEIYIEI